MHLQRQERALDEIKPQVRAAIRMCLTGDAKWPLLLHGDPGTGKTCAALCLLDYTTGGQYFTVGDLCEKLNQSAMGRLDVAGVGHGTTIWPARFRELYLDQPPLLVLDEIGLRSNVSDAHYEAVYRAIELRMGRPFVAITNLDLASIEKIYDARTMSRLASGTIVKVAGADRRIA